MKRLLIILLFVSGCARSQSYMLGIVTGGSVPPPSPSIYKIICDGNSLTFGANFGSGSDSSYPKKLGVLLPSSRVINLGVNGQTTIDMLNDYDSEVAPLYTADSISILLAWEIGNSLYIVGDIDSARAQIKRYCEKGRATGFKVVVATAPYRSGFSTDPAGDNPAQFNAKCDSVNNWVRAHYTEFADGIVNMDQDARVNDYDDATYRDADKIHYKGPGYQVIAGLFKVAVITF